MVINIDIESFADDGLTGVEAVTGLIEIVGLGIVVDIGVDLVDTGQRVEHTEIRLGIVEHGGTEGVEILYALIFHDVGEPLALHAGHIDNVRGIDYIRREVGMLVVADAVGIEKVAVFAGHAELVAGHEVKRGAEVAHGHEQRMDGASVFQVANHGDG